ncbi:MAG: hypothetical protein ACRCU6_04035 [Fusobacteriaceae bacterium]
MDSVVDGIYNFNNPTELVEEVAKERSKFCTNCEYNKEEKISFLKVEDRIPELSCRMCDLCGCVLSYKLRTKTIKTEKCPLKND